MIATGTNATNKELRLASDSKMAAAVNVHTFELLLKNRKFCRLDNLILTQFSLKVSLY